MKRWLVLVLLCVLPVVSCSSQATSTPVPRSSPGPLPNTIAGTVTPPPSPTHALRTYMQLVHERVLVEFGKRLASNRELLSGASVRSFDADMLCPGAEGGTWQHFDDLILELSVIAAPQTAGEFHAALAEALTVAARSAESYDWFCATYTSFGQPADGMWGRLSTQVRACESRLDGLREHWAAMGGDAMGLAW